MGNEVLERYIHICRYILSFKHPEYDNYRDYSSQMFKTWKSQTQEDLDVISACRDFNIKELQTTNAFFLFGVHSHEFDFLVIDGTIDEIADEYDRFDAVNDIVFARFNIDDMEF